MASQVARLWRQRGMYRQKYRQSLEAIRQLHSLMDEVDQDFT